VISAGSDADFVVGDLVNYPVFISNATRPVAVESVLEGLGFANAFVAITCDVLDEGVNPLEDFAVLGLPP
jgi:hypothetical protein